MMTIYISNLFVTDSIFFEFDKVIKYKNFRFARLLLDTTSVNFLRFYRDALYAILLHIYIILTKTQML